MLLLDTDLGFIGTSIMANVAVTKRANKIDRKRLRYLDCPSRPNWPLFLQPLREDVKSLLDQVVESWPIDSGFNHHDRGKLVSLISKEAVLASQSKVGGKEVRIHHPR